MLLNTISDKNKSAFEEELTTKATLGDRSFTCAAPKLWNELPLDIRSARTVNIFKAKLKTHLFRSAFL